MFSKFSGRLWSCELSYTSIITTSSPRLSKRPLFKAIFCCSDIVQSTRGARRFWKEKYAIAGSNYFLL